MPGRGGGTAADGIGSGGSGGGGGGGASANIDGEFAFFGITNIDDLWGYGGDGGRGTWGGKDGADGDYGASNGGDDTKASKEQAGEGGLRGGCPVPRNVPFYTGKEAGSASGPEVRCVSGHGISRTATELEDIDSFLETGVVAVKGSTSVYDGQAHGVLIDSSDLVIHSVSPHSLLAQDAADGGSGAISVGDAEIRYSVEYYDEDGNKLGTAPVMPGSYAAIVTFSCDAPEYSEYNGSLIESVTISKRQVEKPEPSTLTFECGNWETGAGAVQDAFPSLDESMCSFVSGEKADDGLPSRRTASDVGKYKACFRLSDPETCQWEGESEDAAEVWVPWSISRAEFDPNDVTYWGAAYDNDATTVAYTGEPVWVRPWFTPAESTDGEFPEWFTHWGSEGRPTTDRRSSVVVYTQGDDDYEGLVGYHTNADGTLEKVTAEQVYAWVNGVDVGGEHVAVESGDKVWYRTGEDGWKVPLAVQGEAPEGAEGCVVARDYAWADKLGVMEPGEYRAYALFDEGTGFETTALAEATVEVKAAENPMAAKGKTFSAPVGKKTVYVKATAFKISKAKGAVTFKKVSGSNKITVNNKTGAVTVKAGLKEGMVYKVKVKVTAAGDGNYKKASKTVMVTVKAAAKKANPVTAKGMTVTASAKKTKSFKRSKAISVSKAQGAVTFEKVSGSKKVSVTKAGKVTVKKGLKKGKVYKVKVKVTAAGNGYYKKASKTVTVTVKIA